MQPGCHLSMVRLVRKHDTKVFQTWLRPRHFIQTRGVKLKAYSSDAGDPR